MKEIRLYFPKKSINMKIKRIALPLLHCSAAMARYSCSKYVPSRQDIAAFFTTKTLVVLEDNPLMEYNSIIKKVMQQEWNITEYDFISQQGV